MACGGIPYSVSFTVVFARARMEGPEQSSAEIILWGGKSDDSEGCLAISIVDVMWIRRMGVEEECFK